MCPGVDSIGHFLRHHGLLLTFVDHDDRLPSSVALRCVAKFGLPYLFARCIFGGLEILPVALELQLMTMPSPFLLNMT